MPTEPKKNAEDELKRYAEERRRQPAPELHPATRQMLQGEVTRTYGKPLEKKSWLQFLFHPAFAAFAGALLILAVLQFGSNPPKKESPQEAKPVEKNEADAVANRPAPAPAPAPPPVTKPLPAPKAVAPVALEDSFRREEKVAREAPAPTMAASPRALASAAVENLNFSNSAPQQKLPFAANVMNNFQLERVGLRGVRFVDQDQSVYTGTVVASRGGTNLFRAQGDNRTLQSPVVITGQYFTVTPPTLGASQQQSQTRARIQQNEQQQLRLQGQAFVGVTNLIQIEAQSLAPSR